MINSGILIQTKHAKLLRTAASCGLSVPCPGGNSKCSGTTFREYDNLVGRWRECSTCGCVVQVQK